MTDTRAEAIGEQTAERASAPSTIKSLHHVAVLTRDIDSLIDRFRVFLGNEPLHVAAVERPDVVLRTAMIPVGEASGTFVQLIEPQVGPGVEAIEAGGEGTLYEIAFQVDDIEATHDEVVARGEEPLDAVGRRFDGKYLVASSGNRYFYLGLEGPGPRIEIVQVMPRADGIQETT
jgi:glyoxalase/bleomycin resistance protein/dioxygenase superfamily protein